MFELTFIFFIGLLPLAVVLLFSVAWRAFVRYCGYSPEDFQWGSYYSDNSNDFTNSVNSFNSNDSSVTINPASGLPMLNGSSGVDVGGNVYGSNSRHW